jgi:hypothetical protein
LLRRNINVCRQNGVGGLREEKGCKNRKIGPLEANF